MITLIKWLFIVLVIAAGAWYWYTGGTFENPFTKGDSAMVATTTPVTPETNDEASTVAANTGLSTQQGDTSDAALSRDMTTLDSEISGLGSDSTQMDQSLSDKPVDQDY